MSPLVFKLVHYVGSLLWVGGIVAVALAAASVPEGARKDAGPALRRAALSVATPGMVLAFVGGLAILVPSFSALYATAGWMHGKLTLVLLMAGLSGALSGKLRKLAAGEGEVKPGALKGMAGGLLLMAVVVVALATLKPGS